MDFYSYWRSGASYRVRIALNLKGLSPQYRYVDLQRDGGEQHRPAYREVSPGGQVPALALDNGVVLTQSLAMIEYLDEVHPSPPLLPRDPLDRAQVRELAQLVACDIHPLNTSRVIRALEVKLGVGEAARNAWVARWVNEGFETVEALLRRRRNGGRYCFGDAPTLADLCLVPQVHFARRFGVDLSPYPYISAIDAHLSTLPAFIAALPQNQADAPPPGGGL